MHINMDNSESKYKSLPNGFVDGSLNTRTKTDRYLQAREFDLVFP